MLDEHTSLCIWCLNVLRDALRSTVQRVIAPDKAGVLLVFPRAKAARFPGKG